jgi:PAS domain S-box-containing protein
VQKLVWILLNKRPVWFHLSPLGLFMLNIFNSLSKRTSSFLFLIALIFLMTVGAAGYSFYETQKKTLNVEQEKIYIPLRRWIWFTGILVGAVILLGTAGVGLVLRRQNRPVQRDRPSEKEQITLAHNPDYLTQRANELILLLDQNMKVAGEVDRAMAPVEDSAQESLQPNPFKVRFFETSSEVESREHSVQRREGEPLETTDPHEDDTTLLIGSSSRMAEAEGRRFYQSILQDINLTEQELTQIELGKSKGRYRIVSEFASDWTYWKGPDKEVFYVSPACEEISGVTPQEFYKSPELMESIVHPDDQSFWERHSHEELDEKNPGPMEFRILTNRGETRWVSHFCKPVHDHNGKFLGVCGSNRDITSQKRAEEALKIKTEELLRSNAELEQFAYVASHDLQTPLRAISGYIKLLSDRYEGKLDSDAQRFIQRTIDNVARMQRLINDLLTYSRLTTRGHPFEPTDCNAVLNEVMDMLHPWVEESGGTITHGTLPTVMGDRGQLAQLFQNLIGNAIKFRHTDPPNVHFDAQASDKDWLFSVKDNGIGIDPQYSERIFLIFQRLHTIDKYPGTGIGLAICKKIVEHHGGWIWVESKLGEGSTFKFTIPDQGGNRS